MLHFLHSSWVQLEDAVAGIACLMLLLHRCIPPGVNWQTSPTLSDKVVMTGRYP